MEEAKIVIIGAEVVALAVAQELSRLYRDVNVLEKQSSFGQEMRTIL